MRQPLTAKARKAQQMKRSVARRKAGEKMRIENAKARRSS